MVDLTATVEVDREFAREHIQRTLVEAACKIGDAGAGTVSYPYGTDADETIGEAARTYVAEKAGHDPENILVLGIVPPDIYYDVRDTTDEE